MPKKQKEKLYNNYLIKFKRFLITKQKIQTTLKAIL